MRVSNSESWFTSSRSDNRSTPSWFCELWPSMGALSHLLVPKFLSAGKLTLCKEKSVPTVLSVSALPSTILFVFLVRSISTSWQSHWKSGSQLLLLRKEKWDVYWLHKPLFVVTFTAPTLMSSMTTLFDLETSNDSIKLPWWPNVNDCGSSIKRLGTSGDLLLWFFSQQQ